MVLIIQISKELNVCAIQCEEELWAAGRACNGYNL